MNEQVTSIIANELARALIGGVLARIVQVAPLRLAFDLRARDNRLLHVSVEPSRARIYLTRRTLRSLEKEQLSPSQFALVLRKQLGGARLDRITKDTHDRVLRFRFSGHDDAGAPHSRTLIAQLTGRSANLFLLDGDERIIDRLRPARGDGQEIGESYLAPAAPTLASPSDGDELPRVRVTDELTRLVSNASGSPSDVVEEYDAAFERRTRFLQRANAELTRLRRELLKRTKLRANLLADLRTHGDPEAHKRAGDLLLANLASAERTGGRVQLVDYFADDAPVVEIEIDENQTIQEAAAEFFTRYVKAKRAREEINSRLTILDAEAADLTSRVAELEHVVAAKDEAALDAMLGAQSKEARPRGASKRNAAKRAAQPDHIPGTRRYRSSDNFEIIVGRGARENDQLTFRVARPNDLWLHAADYPGAHVVVRNHTRGEIPHRTVVEAAQLAAHGSQAKHDAKVSVHYTSRKFISKPKGAAPGLVRLQQFKTLLVEPREAGERQP